MADRFPITPRALARLQLDADHLHDLGSRALCELLIEMAPMVGVDRLAARLAAYRRVSPSMLLAAGAARIRPAGQILVFTA